MKQKYWLGLIAVIPIVSTTVIAAVWLHSRSAAAQTTLAIALPTPPLIDEADLDILLPPDAIVAIDNPRFEPATKMQDMAPDERVIGIEINGEARAYPLTILSTHEIVNDNIGGEPLVITWCPLCYSALVFKRKAAGELLSFGVSGRLLQNTLVMFDRNTGSLWSQLYGGAISGELAGTPLSVFPSVLTEWSAWVAENPGGQVLSKKLTCAQFDCGTYAENPRGSYTVDPYDSYYASADEGVVNKQIPRDEVSTRPKELVLGVLVNGAARAYPFALLANELVINDEIAGVPVLIWFNPITMTGAAYKREVAGEILTFQPVEVDPALLRDLETSSLWHGISGKGESGHYQGSNLTPLISTPAFEFGWYGYFPQSDAYENAP